MSTDRRNHRGHVLDNFKESLETWVASISKFGVVKFLHPEVKRIKAERQLRVRDQPR